MNAVPFTVAPTHPHADERESTVTRWGNDVKRILCVRLDRLGDVLMTTPAIHALRAAAPERHITLLTSSVGAKLAPFLDDVDEVIAYDAPWHGVTAQHDPTTDMAMIRALRERRFDAAVIFTFYSQSPLPSAMLCYLAGIARRLAHCRENPYQLLTDWVWEPEPQCGVRHEAERQLQLVARIGATSTETRMRFKISPRLRRSLTRRLVVHGLSPCGPWFVIHPGASAASRRYPPERFGEVAARLVRLSPLPILLTGTRDERDLIRNVIDCAGSAAQARLHDLSGELDIGELGALIERACVLIANNSGPVHLASALGTPVVDLYALTNPQHTPWQTEHRMLFRDVECRWCYRGVCPKGHHACLLGVPPAEVASAALELAAKHRSVTPHGNDIARAATPSGAATPCLPDH
ncbi:MAG TPA: glycosyltransferase family 9 protein [Trinickia sp.]|uniref:glycosyltransferase family 9 protein n=1 Tax=Trinickia sp. TaxID=2571163 RepID=UPI002CF32650|nr:glycosyltransferase family 9 protein [Trinickia sp.]HTI17479.1 glycosyltransferase family 9 protein [Trinickia sp.]